MGAPDISNTAFLRDARAPRWMSCSSSTGALLRPYDSLGWKGDGAFAVDARFVTRHSGRRNSR
jgi:hypothetical protein